MHILKRISLGVVIILFCTLSFSFILSEKTFSDEIHHTPPIIRFMKGNYTLQEGVTTPPTFHIMYAYLIKQDLLVAHSFFKDQYPTTLEIRQIGREVSFIFSGIAFLFLFLIAREIKINPYFTTLKFAFLPFAFPIFATVYSDISAIAFLLASLYAAIRGRQWWSIFAFIGSIFMRQIFIFWIFIPLFILYKKKGLAVVWPFALLIMSFVLFVYYNGGVAIGDKGNHHITFNPTTLLFFLILFFMFNWVEIFYALYRASIQFFAYQNKNIHKIRIGTYAGISILMGILFEYSFAVTHYYNTHFPFYLHNRFLLLLRDSSLWRYVFILCALSAALYIWHSKYTFVPKYMLMIVGVGSILFLPLIEPRYYLPLFILYSLFGHHNNQNEKRELFQLAVNCALTIYIVYGIHTEMFFL